MQKDVTQGSLATRAIEADNTYPNRGADRSYAFMKEGVLVVQHPPEGPYPLVIPCPGVRLIVNGQERTQATPVSMQDTVLVEAVNERREGEWSVTISPDGLEATLWVSPTVVLYRKLADLPAASKLQLAVVEREEFLPPLTWDELLEELSRLGINYGVDWQACSRGVTSCTEEKVVIAKGIPAKPGKDSRVELLFSTDSKVPVLVGEEETVDFRERYVFTSVEAGKILAVKYPPEPGHPGTSVKGDIIIPPSPQDCILVAGEGVVLTNDGERAVAARDGRPVATHRHNLVKISVLSELAHMGDVNLSSGNISFKGDVVVAGNVEEGMKVEASGNIRVGGLVSGSKIQATGSILIRGNILKSVVTAGGAPAYMQQILPQVRALATGLREVILSINQVLGNPAFKKNDLKYGIGPLVKLLLEGKFRYLPTVVETLKKQVNIFPLELIGEGFKDFIQEVERVVVNSSMAIHNLNEVEVLARQAAEWEQVFVTLPSTESDVVTSGAINSTIIATGNVRVGGGGCYNSRIQAGKKVTVTGVFRGGEIQAGGDVHVGELGSGGGTATRVVAGPRAKVTVKYAFENSLVVVGARVYCFDRKEKSVCLWLDKEGNLQSRSIPD